MKEGTRYIQKRLKEFTQLAIQLSQNGLTSREISTHLFSEYGVEINYATITRWLKKFKSEKQLRKNILNKMDTKKREISDIKSKIKKLEKKLEAFKTNKESKRTVLSTNLTESEIQTFKKLCREHDTFASEQVRMFVKEYIKFYEKD